LNASSSSRSEWNRRRSRNRDHFVLAGEPRDRHDVMQRHRRLVHDDAAEHDEPGDHHRVAVAALGADEARQSDRSAAPATLSTGTIRTRPDCCSACCIARAV
jgi:hypothetical protein